MLSTGVLEHLRTELARDDPWSLETNLYEQSRYSVMLEFMAQSGKFVSGLEVGCAAGAFTSQMVQRCERLRVVDVLPAAIARCRQRLAGCQNIQFSVADIAEIDGWNESYDLIVIAEVLYYLEAREKIVQTVAKLGKWLKPGGLVIFGSATDSVSSRWGLSYGAETAMSEWSKELREVERRSCIGLTLDDFSLFVKYVRNA
jgi:2-polyprenyl-3-methyl-5-hydroxy-6-metoxy-1,4-benzoquinol methylase